MNSIISLPRLIDLLSRTSSKDRALCEEFVRCFSNGIGDALGRNGSVRIKGFGLFNVVVSGDTRRIVFIPDRELADAVNAPFACFEPVELAPGVSEEVLSTADDDMADTVTGNIIYASETETIAVTDEVSESQSQMKDESVSDYASEDQIPADSTSVADEEPSTYYGEESVVEASEEAGTDSEEETSGIAGDSTADSYPTPSDVSDDLIIDFGFEMRGDAAAEVSGDISVGESSVPDTDVPVADTPDVSFSTVTEEPSDTYSGEEDTTDIPSEVAADPVDTEIAAETDEIVDLPPAPWAEKSKEEGEFTDLTGLGLLTPEARQRMLEGQSRSHDKDKSGGFSWFWIAIAYIGGMAIGFILGFFGHDYLKGLPDEDQTIDLSEAPAVSAVDDEVIDLTNADEVGIGTQDISLVQMSDSAELKELPDSIAAVAKPDSVSAPHLGQPPVYDTITPNRNLNSLALKHYGNKVYWVYIFLDNQDKIKNPNNVIVGTKLRIPPKEQYDVSDTDEKANIEAAFRKQSEIYTKYGMQ